MAIFLANLPSLSNQGCYFRGLTSKIQNNLTYCPIPNTCKAFCACPLSLISYRTPSDSTQLQVYSGIYHVWLFRFHQAICFFSKAISFYFKEPFSSRRVILHSCKPWGNSCWQGHTQIISQISLPIG